MIVYSGTKRTFQNDVVNGRIAREIDSLFRQMGIGRESICLLAPTALNQQKFKIVVDNENIDVVKSGIGFYLDVDLGIVKAAKDLVSNKISLD